MSEVLDKMKSRRSIRKYKPDMVPQDVLNQIISHREAVVPDHGLHRARADPLVAGGLGVVVIEAAAGGVPAVQGVQRGADGGGVRGVVDGAVADAAERAGLVDHAGDGVGKGRAGHPVQHHRRHGHLALVGLAPGLGVHQLGQQPVVGGDDRGRGRRHAAAGEGDAHGGGGGGAHAPVGGQAVLALEGDHRLAGLFAVFAVRRAGEVAPLDQLLLHLGHVAAAGAHLQHRRQRPGGEGQRQRRAASASAAPPSAFMPRLPAARAASSAAWSGRRGGPGRSPSSRHSVGYSTHHQLRPSPAPITTRSARYSPAGTSRSPYRRSGKSNTPASADTAPCQPQTRARSSAASSMRFRLSFTIAQAASASGQSASSARAHIRQASRTSSFSAWAASPSSLASTCRRISRKVVLHRRPPAQAPPPRPQQHQHKYQKATKKPTFQNHSSVSLGIVPIVGNSCAVYSKGVKGVRNHEVLEL